MEEELQEAVKKKRKSIQGDFGKVLRTVIILALGLGIPGTICYTIFKFLIPVVITYNDAYKDFIFFLQKVITLAVVAFTYKYVSAEMEKIVTLIPERFGDRFPIKLSTKNIEKRMYMRKLRNNIENWFIDTFLVDMD